MGRTKKTEQVFEEPALTDEYVLNGPVCYLGEDLVAGDTIQLSVVQAAFYEREGLIGVGDESVVDADALADAAEAAAAAVTAAEEALVEAIAAADADPDDKSLGEARKTAVDALAAARLTAGTAAAAAE